MENRTVTTKGIMLVYYNPYYNELQVFQTDNSVPSMIDFSWYEEGRGWSQNLKGTPESWGWIKIGDLF